jgi:hypothetical protein
MSWLTDKKFVIGALVGVVVGPYVLKGAQGLLAKVKSKG